MSTSRAAPSLAHRSSAPAVSRESRLSYRASAPQGPGCSTMTQVLASEAVPHRPSLWSRDTSEHGSMSVIDNLEEPLADQAADQHHPALLVQHIGEVADPDVVSLQESVDGILGQGGHGHGPVRQVDRQPVAGDGDLEGPAP